MKKTELTKRLKEINLTKKQFAELANISYNTVNNWNSDTKPVPPWVKSWIDNYELANSKSDGEQMLSDIMQIQELLKDKDIDTVLGFLEAVKGTVK